MAKTNSNGSGATSIHISLQGKGGVGKSLISAILSQYLLSKGQEVRGIDADPVNQTLSEYRGLAVSRLNLLKEGSVDQREFDVRCRYGGIHSYPLVALRAGESGARLFAGERQARVHPFGGYRRSIAERHARWVRAARGNDAGEEFSGLAERV